MPADTMEKQTASPLAGAPANGTHTPDKPKSASEHRKSSKPIMEKRRRARINESLGQLKTLILDALKKDSSRHSKLEKADILEMTVKHLRNLQRVQMSALSADATVISKYRAGFNECMNEVEAPQPPVQLHGPDDVHELPAAGRVPAGAPGATAARAAAIQLAPQRRRHGLQARPRGGHLPQGLWRLSARARERRTVCVFDPEPGVLLRDSPRHPALRERRSARYGQRQSGARRLGIDRSVSDPRHDVLLRGVPGGQSGRSGRGLGGQRARVEALVARRTRVKPARITSPV
uniref:Hairy-related 9 n=1 Tax=Gasterosteus aculeatus aculeatus TaxID=481459 RepID=A0AAQ4QEJ2_GASAC